MEHVGQILQHLKGPIPLIGLALLVLAGLVQQLSGRGGDRQTRRTLVLGLLALGALVCVGGLWLELQANSAKKSVMDSPMNANNEAELGSNTSSMPVQQPVASPSPAPALAPHAPIEQAAHADGHGQAINAVGSQVHVGKE